MILLAPSILAADFARLGEEVRACEEAGADRLHVDIMDNRFVPNLTMGPDTVAACRRSSALPIEAHLMVFEPDGIVPSFVSAGADLITVHWEAVANLHRTVELIRKRGVRPGVGVNPGTPVGLLRDILPELDLALVMSVDPGFGGQAFIPAAMRRLGELRSLVDELQPNCEIEVDGGIDQSNAAECVVAGATVLVAGTSVFRHPGGVGAGVGCLLERLGRPPRVG